MIVLAERIRQEVKDWLKSCHPEFLQRSFRKAGNAPGQPQRTTPALAKRR